jgi:hypothetical protein
MDTDEGTAKRPQPIKILGRRGTLASLAGGAVLGLTVGIVLSSTLLLILSADALPGMLIMTVLFAAIYAPTLSFGAAVILASAGVRREDIGGVGWRGLLVSGLVGILPGIVAGGIAGYLFLQMVTAGDAILFMFADIGGMVGALIAWGMRLSRHAARRAGAASAVV